MTDASAGGPAVGLWNPHRIDGGSAYRHGRRAMADTAMHESEKRWENVPANLSSSPT
ncbi:hypothetical protein D3OALGA1CA_4162 [Olavius algarvensis associated proteobacterium Delta 3]|nr:hypothetical protein D3OALGB2SA_1375 [Olavius algarvensis associated proteobacterium Delta 3]CAB5146382.1 hypothetical protein D3OALGA1CA_4162 [Olavius algarvensis associated proteobacterium Delta 3]